MRFEQNSPITFHLNRGFSFLLFKYVALRTCQHVNSVGKLHGRRILRGEFRLQSCYNTAYDFQMVMNKMCFRFQYFNLLTP